MRLANLKNVIGQVKVDLTSNLRLFHSTPYLLTKWTDEELGKLKEAHGQYGPAWSIVASKVKSRNPKECRKKFLLINGDSSLLRAESDLQMQGYEKVGNSWYEYPIEDAGPSPIDLLTSRITTYKFRKTKKREGWTEEEELALLEAYDTHGPQWKLVSECRLYYAHPEIIRTRDQELLRTMDVLVDVGGVYDPEKLRFDHHQASFNEYFSSKFNIKLSSAGLIYKHFGRQVLAELQPKLKSNEASLEGLYQKIYEDFILTFDAIDNGVSQYPKDIKPKYRNPPSVFTMVDRLNPSWNGAEASNDSSFYEAMKLLGKIFCDELEYLLSSWLPARTVVEQSIANTAKIQDSQRILILDQSCPWKEHLFEIEQSQGIDGHHLYVIYRDSTNKDYRIQAVPLEPESFESRKALPVGWRGLRDQELDRVTGIENCVFVHASGFIGGNKTLAGAIAMASLAMKE